MRAPLLLPFPTGCMTAVGMLCVICVSTQSASSVDAFCVAPHSAAATAAAVGRTATSPTAQFRRGDYTAEANLSPSCYSEWNRLSSSRGSAAGDIIRRSFQQPSSSFLPRSASTALVPGSRALGNGRSYRRQKQQSERALHMSAELEGLGRDALIFLASTCAVVPACKKLNISPVLGFLGIGAILGPAGLSLIKDLGELDTLGELGISFLLFEQGLELSLDRLKALSKYAFGLGTLQVCGRMSLAWRFPFLSLLGSRYHIP